ncbi:hypothetical protein Cadr_000009080 [Camelus dromedarius]|uniref:Uncharacterized protein n=1 Tax=Camelus dromedarius TaxID=9838 RepID=A0A5N4DIZ9_CAMDR|nr:hypothetical protein Cadr_000009080 [Camelus dromedarius]
MCSGMWYPVAHHARRFQGDESVGPVQGLQGKEDLCSASSWPPSFLSRAGAPIFTLHWVLRPLLILGAPTSPVTSEFPACSLTQGRVSRMEAGVGGCCDGGTVWDPSARQGVWAAWGNRGGSCPLALGALAASLTALNKRGGGHLWPYGLVPREGGPRSPQKIITTTDQDVAHGLAPGLLEPSQLRRQGPTIPPNGCSPPTLGPSPWPRAEIGPGSPATAAGLLGCHGRLNGADLANSLTQKGRVCVFVCVCVSTRSACCYCCRCCGVLGKCEVRDPKGEWVALLGWGLGVSEGGSHVGTSQQRSSFLRAGIVTRSLCLQSSSYIGTEVRVVRSCAEGHTAVGVIKGGPAASGHAVFLQHTKPISWGRKTVAFNSEFFTLGFETGVDVQQPEQGQN